MRISTFEDLLTAARQQPEPQRLLFVFATAELPEGSSQQEAEAFEAGHGGALVPLMCASKAPEEIESFDKCCVCSQTKTISMAMQNLHLRIRVIEMMPR